MRVNMPIEPPGWLIKLITSPLFMFTRSICQGQWSQISKSFPGFTLNTLSNIKASALMGWSPVIVSLTCSTTALNSHFFLHYQTSTKALFTSELQWSPYRYSILWSWSQSDEPLQKGAYDTWVGPATLCCVFFVVQKWWI